MFCYTKLIVIQYEDTMLVMVVGLLIKDFLAFHFNQMMKRFSYLDRCISYRSFLALFSIFISLRYNPKYTVWEIII